MRLQALLTLLLVVALAPLAAAQTHVQLILDASGSMWNKLEDGRYRIVAAKEVLASFISSLPADKDLHVGLRIYGSQVRALEPGACEDSKLFVPMQGVARSELLAAVQSAQAIGSTPIAYSLERAAQDFPSHGRNLIVLVTDGEEACGGDLQATVAAIRARGIELDIRIIGFDLTTEAEASFAGIGTFESARSAAELAEALGRAVEIAAPAVDARYPVAVRLTRRGEPAQGGVTVVFVDVVNQTRYSFGPEVDPGSFSADLPAGSYRAEIEDAFGTPQSFGGLSVSPDADNAFAFELAPDVEVALQVTPNDPVAGSEVAVRFEGAPTVAGSWITVVPQALPDDAYLGWRPAVGSSGEVALRTPEEAAVLEARFHLALPEGGTRVIGRSAPFSSREATVRLTAPEGVGAGSRFEVAWEGPDNPNDYVTIVPEGAPEGTYLSYAYTRHGNPVALTAPLEPGRYEVRYASDSSGKTLASQPITVSAQRYAVSAPAGIPAGSRFEVAWEGPNNPGDYITIVPEGAPEGAYLSYAYTRHGNPVALTAPLEPGRYEVRYSSEKQSPNPTLASVPVTLTPVQVTLEAPREVEAGSSFEVRWSGPDGDGDYITIVPAGAPDGAYLDYAYTRSGNPVTLRAPDEPGNYEVRYASDRVAGTFARVAIAVK